MEKEELLVVMSKEVKKLLKCGQICDVAILVKQDVIFATNSGNYYNTIQSVLYEWF